MEPFTMAAIMAAAGLAKNALVDLPQQRKQAKLQAATARYSPWTGLQPQNVPQANPVGDMISGGLQGYALQQQMDVADQLKETSKAQLAKVQAETSLIDKLKSTIPGATYNTPQDVLAAQQKLLGTASQIPQQNIYSTVGGIGGTNPWLDPRARGSMMTRDYFLGNQWPRY